MGLCTFKTLCLLKQIWSTNNSVSQSVNSCSLRLSVIPVSLSRQALFSLVGVMLMTGRVCFVSPGKQARIFGPGLQVCLQLHLMFLNFPSWDFKIKVHFSSTAAEKEKKKTDTKQNSWALCVCCWSRPPQQFSLKSFIILVY